MQGEHRLTTNDKGDRLDSFNNGGQLTITRSISNDSQLVLVHVDLARHNNITHLIEAMASQRVSDGQGDASTPNGKLSNWDPTLFFSNEMTGVCI